VTASQEGLCFLELLTYLPTYLLTYLLTYRYSPPSSFYAFD